MLPKKERNFRSPVDCLSVRLSGPAQLTGLVNDGILLHEATTNELPLDERASERTDGRLQRRCGENFAVAPALATTSSTTTALAPDLRLPSRVRRTPLSIAKAKAEAKAEAEAEAEAKAKAVAVLNKEVAIGGGGGVESGEFPCAPTNAQ